MVISSRTPEGEDNCCPICGNALRLEPSRPPGDAPCPCCGVLVRFPNPGVESPSPPLTDRSRSRIGRIQQSIGAKLRQAVESVRGGA